MDDAPSAFARQLRTNIDQRICNVGPGKPLAPCRMEAVLINHHGHRPYYRVENRCSIRLCHGVEVRA